jgi:cysteine synthase A
MMTDHNLPHRPIDLDSVAHQKPPRRGEVRAAQRERISVPTIPHISVGGEHIGGATETLDAFNEGRLQDLLKQHGVAIDQKRQRDAYSFMPTWLHPR